MAGAVGSATYNSQKPLREGHARAANQRPRCRAIKSGRAGSSASLGYGGEVGLGCEDHRGPSTAILLRWGSPTPRLHCIGAPWVSRPAAAAFQCAPKAEKGSAALPLPSFLGRTRPWVSEGPPRLN